MSDAQRLMEIVGPELMQRICQEFAGEQIYIPKRAPDPHRDVHIIIQFAAAQKLGATCMNAYEQCADETGLSVRRVQQIVAGR